MQPSITAEEKDLIRKMLPEQVSDEHDNGGGTNGPNQMHYRDPMDGPVIRNKKMNKLRLFATKAMYEAMKRLQKEKKLNVTQTLKHFGYKFDYRIIRENMDAINDYAILVFLQNNWHHDVTTYDASKPKTLDEWYYELARFCNGDEGYSSDTLHILASCCYDESSVTVIKNDDDANKQSDDSSTIIKMDSFAVSIEGIFSPVDAINIFLLENMNKYFETSIAETIFIDLMKMAEEH
jgi:hypothetical protein